MWTGVTASVGAYRKKIDVPMRVLVPLVGSSIVGGLIGAVLLLKTPAQTFMRILPWLMLAATLLFAFGKKFYRAKTPASATTLPRVPSLRPRFLNSSSLPMAAISGRAWDS